jgi:hypothetical protein
MKNLSLLFFLCIYDKPPSRSGMGAATTLSVYTLTGIQVRQQSAGAGVVFFNFPDNYIHLSFSILSL